ncbi:MAG TPA: type IV pilus twitching motility protein PilT [Pyrinomonadaceae bacterium]|jgi:twitching motility protein PilT|nr:type IV pilus twitching motility protein PilT [Pyrinomonadaceae bacterium]
MERLNDYLQKLLSSCSDELRLEPNKNPYLVAENSTSDVGQVPLMGTQISTMVFPIIPPQAKSELPHSNEIEFVHAHELGNFNFTVQKSSAGFIVAIRPVIGENSGPSINVPQPLPDVPPAYLAESASEFAPEPQPEYDPAPAYEPAPVYQAEAAFETSVPSYDQVAFELESSSSAYDLNSQHTYETSTIPELMVDEPAQEYVPSGGPEIEIIDVNDPSYQTVFSDTAPDPPLRRRSDFLGEEIPSRPVTDLEIEFSDPPNRMEHPSLPPIETFVPPPAPAAAPPPAAPTAYIPEPPAEAAFVAAPANSAMASRMDALFQSMAELGASDLHLSVSMPPMIRKDGKMKQLQQGDNALTAETMRDLLTSIMPPRNQEEFAARSDTDFAYEIPGLARFRCNIFEDRKGMGAVFRIIPSKILTAEQLGLSKAIMDLCGLSKGLVVVTGPTGSGKSTTLCAMVDSINKQREDHIITIEDPIEFVHDNHKCLVNQREVHNHTDSFKDALRAALREDPDIVLVGEMRDLETISIAIETAETGHLVFGTLHTTTAASTVDRIIDQFPADRQQQIRVMLSESLKGVIAQTLLPKKGGGRVAALEVLIVTPAISNLIREGKTFQIPSTMQTGKNHGMVMLNDALFAHVQAGVVEPLDAYIKSVDKTGFETMLTRGGFKL